MTKFKNVSHWKGKKRGAFSEEHKKKISEAKKGCVTWNKGLKMEYSSPQKGKTLEEICGIKRAKEIK